MKQRQLTRHIIKILPADEIFACNKWELFLVLNQIWQTTGKAEGYDCIHVCAIETTKGKKREF